MSLMLTPQIKLDDSLYDISHFMPFDDAFGEHSHNCVEIVVIIKGNSEHFINEVKRPAVPGAVFFIMPGDVHRFTSCKTIEHFTISCTAELLVFFGIDINVLHGISQKLSANKSFCCQLNSLELYSAQKLLHQMNDEFSKLGQFTNKLKFHSLFTLFLAIIAQAEERRKNAGEIGDKHYVENIEQFIREHFESKLQLQQLAKYCHHSVSQLIRKFRQYYGCTPIAYQQKLRLAHAEELLIKSSFTITEIAYKCGFTSGNYFSKQFHQHYGTSPQQFRKIRITTEWN